MHDSRPLPSGRDYVVETSGLKGFARAHELGVQWKLLRANFWTKLRSVIEQIAKCYRTAANEILNTGNDELVNGLCRLVKVANRLLREKKNQLLTETMRAPRAEEEVGQLWKANK